MWIEFLQTTHILIDRWNCNGARADAGYVAHHPDANNIRVQHFAGNAYMPTSGTVQTMGFCFEHFHLCLVMSLVRWNETFRMGWTNQQ